MIAHERARTDSLGSLDEHLERVGAPMALTSGADHTLVFANAAFRKLFGAPGEIALGATLADSRQSEDTSGLTALLNQAFRTGVVLHDTPLGVRDSNRPAFSCSIWPDVNASGESEYLLIELRHTSDVELAHALQRDVAERLLVSALREQSATEVAESSRRTSEFLLAESRRLADSLDEQVTLTAVARIALPHLGAWSIVDMVGEDGHMHRLAIVHPDTVVQDVLDGIHERWQPAANDKFGLPALTTGAAQPIVADATDPSIFDGSHDAGVLNTLRGLNAGLLLTVPMVIRNRLIGALTFVSRRGARQYTQEDMQLAQDLANRSSMALERARLYGEAVALRVKAEAATVAKGAFLDMMSHELRTPLNAIGGYVDLLDLELHGPINEAQHVDLGRIRNSQRYLTSLVNDLLNLTHVRGGHLAYDIRDIGAFDVLTEGIAIVEPLIVKRGLTFSSIACDPPITVRGDHDKVLQILINLLSNAVKFTPEGGELVMDCLDGPDVVLIRVCDTGIGIPADKLESIFEPFVQVKVGALGGGVGVGLGLSISRTLARDMHGDLTAESTLGQGARFTLTLPKAGSAST
jgi:signal transduction histidine kinase